MCEYRTYTTEHATYTTDSDTNLQIWAMEHRPKEEMIWKQAFWDNLILWREKIIPMFHPRKNDFETWSHDHKLWKEDQKRYYNHLNENHFVIGEHWSKSIRCPVVKILYKGCEIVFRENFYGYEIAIISPVDLDFTRYDDSLFLMKKGSYYYQGIPEEYQLETTYNEDHKQFITCVDNNYQFYTFMFLLKNEIDNKIKE